VSDVAANLAEIRMGLAAAAAAARRDLATITLVAVSKTQPLEMVMPALAAGQVVFGESRVLEARDKWRALKAERPDLRLHMIGPLQTNKVRDAIALFDVIETLDRPKLARVLAEEMRRADRWPLCLVQVNTGREPQKAGIDPDQADRLIAVCRQEYSLPIAGVMGIPPVEGDPLPHFEMLAAIAARNQLGIISMGMSGDYPAAIKAGATHVRIGTAIFGAR